MSDDINRDNASYLPASGFTHTHLDVHSWAGKVVGLARSVFGEERVTARLWAYREQGRQHLSCDLCVKGNSKISLPITICAEGKHYFPDIKGGAAEADTYDMAEALHLAGLITEALNATIEVGLKCNEINEEILEEPLSEGQTNGKVDLSFN